jgi:hypothetical protein
MTEACYLGDSVYVGLDDARRVVLYLENGFGPTSLIVLEPEVLASFEAWLDRLKQGSPK